MSFKSQADREKIESYYNIRINDNIPSLPQAIVDGTRGINPRQSSRVVFSFGLEGVSSEDSTKELENKGCIVFKDGFDFFSKLYPELITPEVVKRFTPDDKTVEVLEDEKEKIGLLGVEGKEDGDSIHYPVFEEQLSLSSSLTVGKDNQDRWCAEISTRGDIDSSWTTRFVFDHEPSLEEIQTAHFMESFMSLVHRQGWQEVNVDGKHWTELEGESVSNKLSNFFEAKGLTESFDFGGDDSPQIK